MPRMQILSPSEQEAFDDPPVFDFRNDLSLPQRKSALMTGFRSIPPHGPRTRSSHSFDFIYQIISDTDI